MNNSDMRLLEILSLDARLSHEEIAVMMGMDTADVDKRISELEKEGIIRGYYTLINWDNTNDERVSALIEVKVTPQRGIGFDKIAERISKFDEVKSVYLMSGGFDFTVILEEKTMKEIAQFVTSKLSTLDEVLNTATHFVLKKYKDYGVTMMEEHKDERMLVTP